MTQIKAIALPKESRPHQRFGFKASAATPKVRHNR